MAIPADSLELKSELRVAGFAGQRSPSAELSSARSAAKKAPHRERVSGSARLTMSFDAKTQAILSFLQAQAAAAPELAGEYAQMEDLYKRKLWHQLTCVLEAFMVLPAAASHLVPGVSHGHGSDG